MGNSLLEKYKSAKCCLGKENLFRSSTIKIDDLLDENNKIDTNANRNQNSNEINPEIGSKRKNLMNSSSLMKIDSQSQNSNSNKVQIKFSISNLNEDCLEELNISEDTPSYNFFFSKVMEEINKARTDFLGYSKLIKKYADEIKTDTNNKNYLLSNGNKIYFNYGRKDFLESAKILENMYRDFYLLKKFEYAEDITFPLPKIRFEKILQDEYIRDNFEELKNKFKGKYDIKSLLFFRCTKDPQISIIVQLVIDLKRQNEKYLLSDGLRFININFKTFKNGVIGIFIVLAN